MNLTPAERSAWRGHFKRYPHGDFYTHKLLADILCIMVKTLGGKDSHPREFAPWLYPEKEITDPHPNEDLILKSLQAMVDNDGS